MKCKLEIIDLKGLVVNTIEYDIPIAISNDKDKPLRNFLSIGDYKYGITPDGEIYFSSFTIVKLLRDKKMEMEKQLL